MSQLVCCDRVAALLQSHVKGRVGLPAALQILNKATSLMKTRTSSQAKVNLSELSRQVEKADRMADLAKTRVRRAKNRLRSLKKALKQARKAAKKARRDAKEARKVWEQASGEVLAIKQLEPVKQRKAGAASKARRNPGVVRVPRRRRRLESTSTVPGEAAQSDLAGLPPGSERPPETPPE
jgi:predicted RNase H-like nuclease (RuvC/YqgF family)